MDINRNLERYFESNHLDEAIGTDSWRDEIRKELQRYPPSQEDVRCPGATKIILSVFQEQLRSIGYSYVTAADKISFKNSKKSQLYFLLFASKHEKGHEFWNKIKVINPSGQRQITFE